MLEPIIRRQVRFQGEVIGPTPDALFVVADALTDAMVLTGLEDPSTDAAVTKRGGTLGAEWVITTASLLTPSKPM